MVYSDYLYQNKCIFFVYFKLLKCIDYIFDFKMKINERW